MKVTVMEAEVSNKGSDSFVHNNKMEAILKRQAERKKLEKNGTLQSNLSEVEKFTDLFNKKQKKIEAELQSLRRVESGDHMALSAQLTGINGEIQELQKLYSNATLFLRIYDKKIFQESLQALQSKLQNVENQLMPKKKFGFKVKKSNIEAVEELKFGENRVSTNLEISDLPLKNFVGICGKSNEELTLEGDEIIKRDIVVKDVKNCCIHLKGVPTTVHATGIEGCQLYFGPVMTSVFFENVKDSSVHLACQQLRIHDSLNTDFYVHVTSKPVIENCKKIRFGPYEWNYDGIESDFEISGLSKEINNWEQVDDFNWLITNKPSPNWSKITN